MWLEHRELNCVRVGNCSRGGDKRMCESPVKDLRICSEVSGNALKSSDQESDAGRLQGLN